MAPPTQLSIRDEENFCTLHTNRFGKYQLLVQPENLIVFLTVDDFPRFSFLTGLNYSRVSFRKKLLSVSPSVIPVVFRKMKYLYFIVPAILAVILSISSKRAAAQPVCNSAYLDNPQNRKLCATLANLFGLPNSLEAYSDEIRPNYGYGLPLSYKGRLPPSDFVENMPGTKRQDVDHVFLRFGRRR